MPIGTNPHVYHVRVPRPRARELNPQTNKTNRISAIPPHLPSLSLSDERRPMIAGLSLRARAAPGPRVQI
eukprot:4491903-Prymnesium_polylepis.1